MPSQVDIVNRALLRMSARAQVSSINPSDGSKEADAAAVLFTPTFEMLARAAHWNIFRKQAALTLLKAASGTPENPLGTTLPAPPSPWLYSYAYPSDCLCERFLLPTQDTSSNGAPWFQNVGWAASNPASQAFPFVVAYDTDSNGNPIRVILTNLSQAQAVYTVNQPNPDGWDSQFQEAMAASLAVWLIPALTGNSAMMQISIQLATNIVNQARVTDGDEGLTVIDNIPDWIRVRGAAWGGSYSNLITPFSPLAWPAV